MKVSNPTRNLLSNFTGLFKIQGCAHCRLYEEFIQKIISKLPHKIHFEIIDCTDYHDYGVVTDKRIPIFLEHYQGSYPSLIVNGNLIPGANSMEEAWSYVSAYFDHDFVTDEDLTAEAHGKYYPLTFNKSCKFVKKGFFKRGVECKG